MTPDLITTPGVVVSGNAAPQNFCHSLSARVGRLDPSPWTEAKIVGGCLPPGKWSRIAGSARFHFPCRIAGSARFRYAAPFSTTPATKKGVDS